MPRHRQTGPLPLVVSLCVCVYLSCFGERLNGYFLFPFEFISIGARSLRLVARKEKRTRKITGVTSSSCHFVVIDEGSRFTQQQRDEKSFFLSFSFIFTYTHTHTQKFKLIFSRDGGKIGMEQTLVDPLANRVRLGSFRKRVISSESGTTSPVVSSR